MHRLLTGSGSNSSIVLNGPSGIVRDPNSNILYIACVYNHEIVSYPSGNIVAGGNGQGINRTQLKSPIGLVYDSFSNSFIIGNYGAHNIIRWSLGASNWTHIVGSISGLLGNTSTLLNQPVGVTLDPMGNIYVADSGNHRIQLILNGQSEGTTIAGINGIYGSNSTLLYRPYWVKLDNQLNLYVADTFNGRIQKFLRY
ncbi:unnamed protein product [Rotaria sordida]|uniref:NHL repeat-containing protein n=1 Tax=Rotaria sordida TaxID=392033 RepID=A0A815Y2C7_9BILA|nr:unnamed protein product [Rotaria sordida]CAF1564719.1 unnamed protein product [Rotaria sordida]